MSKDRYYFPHDHNARNDRKIAALVRDFKSSGYGVFWATCEMMHEEGGEIEFDELTIEAISKDLNEEKSIVETILDACINKYKLFVIHEKKLNSARVKKNLTTKDDKRQIKANSGRLGGIKSGESRRYEKEMKQNEAMLQPASSNEAKESKETKESKGKEIKESKETEQQFWFLKYYHSTYENYKEVFNGRSATNEVFIEWKEFIDFVYKEKFEGIMECKFINPKDFGIIVHEKGFKKAIWKPVIEKILSTGIKPEHDLFYRIPQFMNYFKDKKDGKKGFIEAPDTDFDYTQQEGYKG